MDSISKAGLLRASQRYSYDKLELGDVVWEEPAQRPWCSLRRVLEDVEIGTEVKAFREGRLMRHTTIGDEMAGNMELYERMGAFGARLEALEKRLDALESEPEDDGGTDDALLAAVGSIFGDDPRVAQLMTLAKAAGKR